MIKKAVYKYLKLKGYDIIDDIDDYIIAFDADDESVVIIGCYDEPYPMTREKFEKLALEFFDVHDEYTDVYVRYDEILVLKILDGSRAFIKHTINMNNELL